MGGAHRPLPTHQQHPHPSSSSLFLGEALAPSSTELREKTLLPKCFDGIMVAAPGCCLPSVESGPGHHIRGGGRPREACGRRGEAWAP